jgi:UPF0271 protein
MGFGRREIKATPEEIHDELIYQLGALREFARLHGLEVQHVKPHGALYMVAARDEELSRAIIGAIQEVDPALVLYCMQSSKTYELAQEMDQPVARELFADREYNDEGQIVFTRRVAEDLDPEELAERTLRGVTEGRVRSVDGNDIEVAADSICVHSDTPGVVRLAEAIVRKLGENRIKIRPVGRAEQRVP